MKSRRNPSWDDLIILVVSAACIAALIKSSVPTIDIIAGLVLIIYLPGAALISTFGPRAQNDTLIERQMWIVGAGLVLSVIGGLVLNLFSSLTRSHWVIWCGGVVVVFLALKLVLALILGRTTGAAVAQNVVTPETLNSDESRASGPANPRNRRAFFWLSLRQTLLFLGAGAICVAALILSIHTQALTTRESFVQAWVLPKPSEDVTGTSVQLGLRNHLGVRRVFLVRVQVGSGVDEIIDMFSVSLSNGASWTQTITRQPGERVKSTVFLSSKPSVVITKVYLAPPVS